MQLKSVAVKNFRLLHDVALTLEKPTTLIVGRNNSGKTSLAEVMKRLLGDSNPSFRFEDFSFAAQESFWNAFLAAKNGANDLDVRKDLPTIEVQLTFSYEDGEAFGTLNEFVIDLNPECTEAHVVARYALSDGKVGKLFADIEITADQPTLLKALRDRIPALFSISLTAVDPNDATNEKIVNASALRAMCASGFISAQRGLDDVSQKDRVVIGKVLENLFTTAKNNAADSKGQDMAKELEQAVKEIQDKMGSDVNLKLDALLPALSLFGYPGLSNQTLRTETTMDVKRLLTNNTKVQYTGYNGIHLPEAYNGLGTRNIILILLQLREFFKLYTAMEPRPGIHIVFIEEPEVHLHPQMQEVFIRKLGEIATVFSKETPWPVQFVVSTHSSHIANEAHFETIRYFLAAPDSANNNMMKTVVKDLSKGLSGKINQNDRNFLHKYMTLTRCDLFFADKAVLIEGTTERLLLPRIIKMLDDGKTDTPDTQKLGSQYLSVIEVGGAYAHIFFDLIDFLDIRTLVITDIDTVNGSNGTSCQVSYGKSTSNGCIRSWFNNTKITPTELLVAKDETKIIANRRIAFQQPENSDGPCGRSFEDAFMLANPKLFEFDETKNNEAREAEAWNAAKAKKKTDFALKYAFSTDGWQIPRYISEGLAWLAENNPPPVVILPKATGNLS